MDHIYTGKFRNVRFRPPVRSKFTVMAYRGFTAKPWYYKYARFIIRRTLSNSYTPSTEYSTIGWFSKRTSSAICTQHPRQKIRIENNLFNRGIKCSLSMYTLYTKIKRNMFWYISITNTIQQGVRMSNWHLQREVDRSAYIINKWRARVYETLSK